MIERFSDKVVLISGAARGQGADEARRFAAEGARVVLGDVLVDEIEALAAELGEVAAAVPLDVTSPEAWASAVATAEDRFGGIDVLVNNAGIALLTPIVGGDVDDYLKVVMVNQVGVYLGMRAAAPAMTARGGGSIVNISSVDGMVGMPLVAGYVSSKFAVRGLTKVGALELAASTIRVNSVHPGFIDTPMLRDSTSDELLAGFASTVPLGRIGTTEEVADLVLFLASDDSRYCTGSEFVIDGGLISGISLRLPAP